jgi:hypothetical protein
MSLGSLINNPEVLAATHGILKSIKDVTDPDVRFMAILRAMADVIERQFVKHPDAAMERLKSVQSMLPFLVGVVSTERAP